jgi:hypothetical protein
MTRPIRANVAAPTIDGSIDATVVPDESAPTSITRARINKTILTMFTSAI